MSTSFADGFRTLQAVRDLRAVTALAPSGVRARIVAGTPDGTGAMPFGTDLDALIDGAPLEPRRRRRVLDRVRYAAALPDEDFPAFLCATSILLIDLLGNRSAGDEVYWLWQTFRQHYRAAGAAQRAAIAQGIRQAGVLHGDAGLLPEAAPDLLTAPTAALRALLEPLRTRGLAPPDPASGPGVAALLVGALTSQAAASEASAIWEERGSDLAASAPPAVLAGFRHVYEQRGSWAPATDVIIPLLDPPPAVDWPH